MMRCHFRRAFTLVELLVVISIIGVLMSLLLPAVMSSWSSARGVKCCNNLRQIGVAFHHYKDKRKSTPDIGTVLHGLGEYTEDQTLTYICPEVGDEADNSYGVHKCVHRLLGESPKIIMMDAHGDTLDYEGSDQATWNEDIAPRHHGLMNVLLYDGSVHRKGPLDVDPYDEQRGEDNLEILWRPANGGCSGPCGIQGVYYALTEWGDNPVFRVDPTINLPFGNAPFFKIPYDIPLKGAKQENPWPLRTGAWYGQIKSDHSETYTFYVSCDNEAWLYIDGKEVLHRVAGGAWGVQQFQAASPVEMSAGRWIDMEVRFKEYHPGTPSHVSVKWQSASTPLDEIPSCNMRPVKPKL